MGYIASDGSEGSEGKEGGHDSILLRSFNNHELSKIDKAFHKDLRSQSKKLKHDKKLLKKMKMNLIF